MAWLCSLFVAMSQSILLILDGFLHPFWNISSASVLTDSSYTTNIYLINDSVFLELYAMCYRGTNRKKETKGHAYCTPMMWEAS